MDEASTRWATWGVALSVMLGTASCDLVKSPRQSHGTECKGPCSASFEHRTGSLNGCGEDGGVDGGTWEREHAKAGADEYCRAHCDNRACLCERGTYRTVVASRREGEVGWGPTPCEMTLRTTYTGQCRSPTSITPAASASPGTGGAASADHADGGATPAASATKPAATPVTKAAPSAPPPVTKAAPSAPPTVTKPVPAK